MSAAVPHPAPTPLLVRAARGEPVPTTPVWFMRQAGRSLPEYKAARGSTAMLQACRTPELVAEITLQPVRRYGVDAAVLYSDIVVPLHAAGVDVDIVPGTGPVMGAPVRTAADVDALAALPPADLGFLTEAVRLTRAELGEVPLLGFAGAPFTLASYLVEGGPSRDHAATKAMMHADPGLFAALLSAVADITARFLRVQVDAGAAAVQLFDSWAGALSRRDYEAHVAPHSARVLAQVTDVPRIHFGTGTQDLLPSLARAGADVVGVDAHLGLDEAVARLEAAGTPRPVQGNLDSALLLAPWPVVAEHAGRVLRAGLAAPGHVFNLGHGVLPATDPDQLARLVDLVHGFDRDAALAGSRDEAGDAAGDAGTSADVLEAGRGDLVSAPDRVVVVGAGISGLAAAHALLAAGVGTVVLEASGRTGGVLHAGDVGGVRVDLGAEAMLARRPEGVDLAAAVGLADLLVAPTAARPAVWRTDGVRPLPSGTVMGVPGTTTDLSALLRPDELVETARALAAAARRRAPAGKDADPDPAAGPGAHDAGDDVSVAAAVERDAGRPVLDLLVEPLLGGVYAGRTDRLSLAATVPALAAALRRGEPLSAAADRAATSGPAPGVPVFTGVDGGMARLAGAVAEDLRGRGADVRTGVRVTGLERVPGGWRLRTTSGPVDAAAVVLALPTTTTARLLSSAVPAAAAALAEVDVAGVAVVALAVAGLEPTTSGLLVPPVEAEAAGVDIKAVTFSGAKWGWVAAQGGGAGTGVLRASLGRAGDGAVLRRDDDALVDLVRRDLEVLLGRQHRAALAAAPAVVARWGGALPQYAPGHLERVARLRAAVAGEGGLAVAGAFLDGVGVPACVRTARGEVDRLLAGWAPPVRPHRPSGRMGA